MQLDCTARDMVPSSDSRSFEGCTAVSDPGTAVVIGRSSGDCMSAAIDAGSHAKTQTKLREERLRCCSDIRPVAAGLSHHIAAGRMLTDSGIAAAVAEVEAAAAKAPADLGILHSGLAGIAHMGLGSDWKKVAGSFRPGSKTWCREGGCGRPSRGRFK